MTCRFVFDSDNTITDLYTPWLERINRDYGESLTWDDIRSWEFHKYTIAGSRAYEYLKQPGLFLNLKPFQHAIEVIHRLSVKSEVFICTHVSSEQEKREKQLWFQEHLPFIREDAIHFTTSNNKNMIDGDVLFDDAVHNLEAWPTLTAAIQYPYNQEANPTRWVHNWLEFERFAEEVITGKVGVP